MGVFIGDFEKSSSGWMLEEECELDPQELAALYEGLTTLLESARDTSINFKDMTAVQEWLSAHGLIARSISPREEDEWRQEQWVQTTIDEIVFSVVFREICDAQTFYRFFVALFFFEKDTDVIGHC